MGQSIAHTGYVSMEVTSAVRSTFEAAGWHPSRRVAVSDRVPETHPAYEILEEMGGLLVGRVGPGEECAQSDIAFEFCEDQEYQQAWSLLLGSMLIGIAEVHNHHGWLFIDERGRCFGASQVHDAFYFGGQTFGEAVEGLLLGRRARPMLRPNQSTIELYGETFKRGHPAIFEYDFPGGPMFPK